MKRTARLVVLCIVGLFLILSEYSWSGNLSGKYADILARRMRASTISVAQAFTDFLPALARSSGGSDVISCMANMIAVESYDLPKIGPGEGILKPIFNSGEYDVNGLPFLLKLLSGGTYRQEKLWQVGDNQYFSIDSELKLGIKDAIIRLNGKFYEILSLQAEKLPYLTYATANYSTYTFNYQSRIVMRVRDIEGNEYTWVDCKLNTDSPEIEQVDIRDMLDKGMSGGWDGYIWSKSALRWGESIDVPEGIVSQARSWMDQYRATEEIP